MSQHPAVQNPAHPLTSPGDLPVRRSALACGQRSALPPETSLLTRLSSAHKGSAFPLLVKELDSIFPRQHSTVRLSLCCALPSFPRHFPLLLACHPLSEEAHLVNTIRNQPNYRHVLTGRPISENNQMVSFLEGESSRVPNPPERPFPTHASKPGCSRGRRCEIMDAVSSNHKHLDAVCAISAFLLRMKKQRLIGLPRFWSTVVSR